MVVFTALNKGLNAFILQACVWRSGETHQWILCSFSHMPGKLWRCKSYFLNGLCASFPSTKWTSYPYLLHTSLSLNTAKRGDWQIGAASVTSASHSLSRYELCSHMTSLSCFHACRHSFQPPMTSLLRWSGFGICEITKRQRLNVKRFEGIRLSKNTLPSPPRTEGRGAPQLEGGRRLFNFSSPRGACRL